MTILPPNDLRAVEFNAALRELCRAHGITEISQNTKVDAVVAYLEGGEAFEIREKEDHA